MKIQYASDLHLEFYNRQKYGFVKNPNNAADILCLVGDICCCGSVIDFINIELFFHEITGMYKLILWVPGNHEYYSLRNDISSIRDIQYKMRQLCAQFKNIVYFDCHTLRITMNKQVYVFIGTTLWTYIPLHTKEERKLAYEMTKFMSARIFAHFCKFCHL
jgi:predicted phosphodiesterase